ncbi:hypothetical protein B6K86_08490 [Lachnospiraceae bacterium]|nr:hypothetical protein B6K86_08490 [Lachnospiraceae bacterium]
MKIATWNIERLKHKKALAEIMSSIDEIKADILVLTETDQRLHPRLTDCGLSLLTKNQPECIDHIALTEDFAGNAEVKIVEWNQSKTLSDHKGIVVSF